MATRVPATNQNGKAGLRDRGSTRGVVDDGTVFNSMREFWLWVAIVTLLLFCIMLVSFGVVHTHKQLNKAEALLLRLEEKEKKREKARTDPKPDSADGL